MSEVQVGRLTVVIVPKVPTKKWSYLTNEYYEKKSGEMLDPDSMPATAKGHTYSVYAMADTTGEYLLVKNVLRAWDEESVPLVEEFDGRPYNPKTDEMDRSKIVHPTKYIHPTVALPLVQRKAFIRRAQAEGWEVADLTWKAHGLEEVMRTLKAVQEDKVSAEDGMVLLEHYWQIQSNPRDPDLVKDFRTRRELRVLLAQLQAAIQTRAPELILSEMDNLEAVLHQLQAVFPWASRAELNAGTITIPLGKGVLALSTFGIEYQESGKTDGITAKKGGRLDNILNGIP